MGLTPNQDRLLRLLRNEAKKMGEDGRALTGLIGELSVCKILGMRWEPRAGYDAQDRKRRKVEIKTRRDSKGGAVNPKGTIGKYGKKGKYNFAYGIYLELNKDFEVDSIYEVSKEILKQLESNNNNKPFGGQVYNVWISSVARGRTG
jgi:hypothetical protein